METGSRRRRDARVIFNSLSSPRRRKPHRFLSIKLFRSHVGAHARFVLYAKRGVARPFQNAVQGFAGKWASAKLGQFHGSRVRVAVQRVFEQHRIVLAAETGKPHGLSVGLEYHFLTIAGGPMAGKFMANSAGTGNDQQGCGQKYRSV